MAPLQSRSHAKIHPSRRSLHRRRQRQMLVETLESRNLMALVAYEGFETYAAATQLVGLNGGTGFTAGWDVVNDANRRAELTAEATSLSYTTPALNIQGGDNALRYRATENGTLQYASRPIPSTTETLYLSFLYRPNNDAGVPANDDFLQLGFDNTVLPNPRASVFDRNVFTARVSTATDSATTTTSIDGETYFIVAKVEKVAASANYNRVSIFVNPLSASEPGTPSAVANGDTGLATISQLALRKAVPENGDVFLMDEFRVGTTYADVIVPAIIVDGPNDVVWDGDAGDGLWSNPLNWVGNANIPDSATETAIFRDTAIGAINLGGATYTINGVRLQNAAGSYIVSNGTLTLASLSNEFTGINTINAPIVSAGTTNIDVQAGALTLGAVNTLDAADTVNVRTGGQLNVAATGNTTALGSARVVMTGGEVEFIGTATTTIDNALSHYGYHTPNATTDGTVLDLNGNGGLLGGAASPLNPANGPNYFGQSILTAGPGGRGLDFNSDADFTATGAIGQADNYSNLFVGILHVSAANAGAWTFQNAGDDDRGGIWVDINGDGTFTSSTAGLGDNRGEQVSWENGTVRTVNLTAGDHLVAFVHRELTGGSGIDIRFKSPTMALAVPIKPADFPGLFSALPITSAVAPLYLTNQFDILGNATMDTGNVPGVILNGITNLGDATTAATLTSITSRGELRLNDTRLNNNATLSNSSPLPMTVANITDGAAAFSVTKTGTTVVRLVTANAVDGPFNVNQGTLQVEADGALGTTVAGIVVADGTTLQLLDGVNYGTTEAITLDGTLLANGNVTFAGPVTTSGNGGILQHGNAPGGTFTLTGAITAPVTLTVQGDGTTDIDGVLSGPGSIVKNNNGSLRLDNNANSFTGGLHITDGRVFTSQPNALGSTLGGTTVFTNGSLIFDGTFTPALEPLQIAGPGENNEGALRSVNGSVMIAAPLTIFQTATITSATAGQELRLTGNIEVHPTANLRFDGAGDIRVPSAFGNGATATQMDNALSHFGYHTPNPATVPSATDAAILDLSLATSLYASGNPVAGPDFFRQSLLTLGPGSRGLDFDSDGDFTASGVVTNTDYYSNLWIGVLHVTAATAGNWTFRGNGQDDRSALWIDLNGDNAFTPTPAGLGDNRGELVVWGANTTAAPANTVKTRFLAAGDYLIAFAQREYAGGSNVDFRFRAPTMVAEETIRPSDPDQVGFFSTFTTGTSIVASNNVEKYGTGTVYLSGNNSYNGTTNIFAGQIIAESSTALGTGSAAISVRNNAAIGLSGGITIDNKPITLAGTGGGTRPGALYTVAGNNVVNGPVIAAITDRGQIGLGASAGTLTINDNIDLEYSGLVFNGAGNVVVNGDISGNGADGPFNAIYHYGYHVNSDAATLNLNNNGGMVNGTPPNPTAFPNFFGQVVLTDGPAGRGLDFNNDQDFLDTGAIGILDNYSNLWLTTLIVTPANAGDWTFQNADNDDSAGIWVDINGNGTFESINAALTDASGEQVAWENTGVKTVTLAAGRHLIAFTHREGSGGSTVDFRIKSPTMAAAEVIRPTSPNQADFYEIILRSDNFVRKLGSGTATLGGDNTYNSFTEINAGTLVARSNSALGTTAAGTTIAGGANLALDGGVTVAELVTVNGPGQIQALSGANTLSGNVIVNQFTEFARLDIGRGSQRVEPGYTAISVGTTADITANFPTTGFVSSFGTNYSVTMNAIDQTGATVGTLDWRDRGDAPTLTSLVRVGEDHVKNNSGVVRVTLGQVPAGTYSVTAYHTDPSATQSSIINVHVNTGSGFSLVTPPGTVGNSNFTIPVATLTTAQVDQTKSTFTFTSDGVNDVIIVFDGRPSADDETPLSGLVIVPITLVTDLAVDAATNASLNITGTINDGTATIGLLKTGTGTVTLSAANQYDGPTRIQAGTLLVNNATAATGTGDVTVQAGGLLGGEGQIAGNVVVAGGGTLSPGMTVNDTGVLRIGGNLDLQPGSTAESDIDGALFDQTVVTGNVTIADGQVIPGGDIVAPPLKSVPYVLLNATGTVTGALATLPRVATGHSFAFDGQIALIFYNYDASTNQPLVGNDIALIFNDAPIARNDSFSVLEEATLTGNVVTNTTPNGADSDPDGDPLSNVTLVGSAPAGAFSLASNGNFTYTPPLNFTGNVQFQYTVSDSNGFVSNIATATITVVNVNDPLIANPDGPSAAYTTGENSLVSIPAAIGVLANDSDVDVGDSFFIQSYTATSASGATVIMNPDGSFTYNPSTSLALQTLPAGATATDTFTYTIAAVHQLGAPIQTPQSSTGAFPVSPSDLLQGIVPATGGTALQGQEGTSSNPAVLTNGTFGAAGLPDAAALAETLSIANNTTLTYTLDYAANPNGFDIAQIDTYSGWRDGGRDNQNYVVRYSLVAAPDVFVDFATVSLAPNPPPSGKVSIAPASGIMLSGVAKLQFVFGGQENGFVGYREIDVFGTPTTISETATATVTMTVVGVNDFPVAVNDNFSIAANAANTPLGNVLTNDTDVDTGASLSVTQVNGANNVGTQVNLGSGALVTVASNGALEYNPNQQFGYLAEGQPAIDTFTYTISDGQPVVVGTPVVAGQASAGAFVVSGSDLLTGLAADVTGTALTGPEGTSNNSAILTNAAFGAAGVINGAENVAISNNTILTFALDTAASPTGYDISSIETFSGWQDAGRTNQNYTIRYATVDNPGVYITLTTVSFVANAASGKATISPSGGSILATRVGEVQFDFGAQQNGHVGYRELDVFGAPSALPSSLTATTFVTVIGVNDAPTVAANSAAVSAIEGQNATNSGTFADIDVGDSVTITASVGTINHSSGNNGAWSWSLPTLDGPSGPTTVTITARDLLGLETSTTFTYSVTNAAPQPEEVSVQVNGVAQDTSSGVIQIVPGLAVTFEVSTTDPAFDHLDAPFQFLINFGDGTSATGTTTAEGDTLTFTHTYTTFQTFQPTLRVTDDDGGFNSPALNLTRIQTVQQVVIDGTLYVSGTNSADRIVVQPASGGIGVRMNNILLPRLAVRDRVVIYGGNGSDTITVGSNMPLKVEFYGGNGDDYLTGGANADILDGGAGRDRLLGGGGADLLLGGPGDDTLSGGVGNDTLYGDRYLDQHGDVQTPAVNLHGRDTLNGDAGDDRVYGDGNSDKIYGGAGNDLLRGGDGIDTISGDAGDDAISGDAGGDKLYGRAGNDVIIGGDSIDTIYGSTGADLIFGNLLDGDTDEQLLDILNLWILGDQQAAVDKLKFESSPDTDGATDLLYGEGDSDWYLLYFGDKIAMANEKAPANKIETLSP